MPAPLLPLPIPDLQGTLYQWTFGDGNTSTQTNPSNTYNTAGTYNVTLSVNFTGGCSNNAAHQVIIGALPLTPTFVAVPATACVNQQVTFTGTSTNPAGTITQWIWNFGDGSPVVNAPTNAAQPHTYTTAGTYIVTLQVKNTAGCLSLVFQNTITIGAIPATPSFNAVSTACLNQPVTFTDVPANPAASITQWTWNFGDGSPVVTAGTNAAQVHTYTVAGAYTVTLQLMGVGGCVSAVFQQTITITAAPVVDFTSTPRLPECSYNFCCHKSRTCRYSIPMDFWRWKYFNTDQSVQYLQYRRHFYYYANSERRKWLFGK